MGRLKLPILLLFAAALALAPVLHNHPLIPTADGGASASSSLCTACTSSTGNIVLAPQPVAVPLMQEFAFAAAPEVRVAFAPVAALPSRAPPAAA